MEIFLPTFQSIVCAGTLFMAGLLPWSAHGDGSPYSTLGDADPFFSGMEELVPVAPSGGEGASWTFPDISIVPDNGQDADSRRAEAERAALRRQAGEAEEEVRRRLATTRRDLEDLGRKADDLSFSIETRSSFASWDRNDLESSADDARDSARSNFRAVQSEIDDLRFALDSSGDPTGHEVSSARASLDDLEWKMRRARREVEDGLDDLEGTLDEGGSWCAPPGRTFADDLSDAGDDLDDLGAKTRRYSLGAEEDFSAFDDALEGAGDGWNWQGL